jgi:ribosomal protein S27E
MSKKAEAAVTCSVCGRSSAEGARFCARCGARLESPPGGKFRPKHADVGPKLKKEAER